MPNLLVQDTPFPILQGTQGKALVKNTGLIPIYLGIDSSVNVLNSDWILNPGASILWDNDTSLYAVVSRGLTCNLNIFYSGEQVTDPYASTVVTNNNPPPSLVDTPAYISPSDGWPASGAIEAIPAPLLGWEYNTAIRVILTFPFHAGVPDKTSVQNFSLVWTTPSGQTIIETFRLRTLGGVAVIDALVQGNALAMIREGDVGITNGTQVSIYSTNRDLGGKTSIVAQDTDMTAFTATAFYNYIQDTGVNAQLYSGGLFIVAGPTAGAQFIPLPVFSGWVDISFYETHTVAGSFAPGAWIYNELFANTSVVGGVLNTSKLTTLGYSSAFVARVKLPAAPCSLKLDPGAGNGNVFYNVGLQFSEV